ncbi:hypothetical protein LIU_02580 [Enterococcus durans]|nr:hypothetical protein LIU_02580 [Enterococcus durans]
MRHLESSYEFVSQINSKGFQGVFSIFFYTKKMLAKFTNIKKYRAKIKKMISRHLEQEKVSILFPALFCFSRYYFTNLSVKKGFLLIIESWIILVWGFYDVWGDV